MLLLKQGVIVRSQTFSVHQVIGNPMSTVERFSNWNVDELVLLDISGRGYSNTLMIYSRDSAGNVNSQEIHGWKMGNFKQMVRDLNGNGEDELIITRELGLGGGISERCGNRGKAM